MKFSAALALAIAPVALGKDVQNAYPVKKMTGLELGGSAVAAEVGGASRGGGAAALAAFPGIVQASSSTEIILVWANAGGGAPTQTVNQPVTVTQTVTEQAAGTAPPGAIQSHQVMVGGAGGLTFTPSEVKANVGDMVVFNFMSTNHTATQSAFTTPCDPMPGGMDTGFMPNPNNSVNPPPAVAMQVMSTNPVWFYCKQMGHCGKGMTFSINPTAQKTQAMFQQMAIAQKGTGSGSAITGNASAAAGGAAASGAAAAAVSSAGASAAPAASSAAGGAVTSGSGQVQGGACVCAVTCASGSFPAVQAQGVGAFGGIAGGLPANMAEA